MTDFHDRAKGKLVRAIKRGWPEVAGRVRLIEGTLDEVLVCRHGFESRQSVGNLQIQVLHAWHGIANAFLQRKLQPVVYRTPHWEQHSVLTVERIDSRESRPKGRIHPKAAGYRFRRTGTNQVGAGVQAKRSVVINDRALGDGALDGRRCRIRRASEKGVGCADGVL